MERIFVTYGRVVTAPGSDDPIHHMAIHYQNSQGQTLVIEAGPDIRSPTGNGALNLLNEEFLSTSQTDSPWGRIVAAAPDLSSAEQLALPQETIITGSNLSQYWTRIVEAGNIVNVEGYEYRPWTQSSNTFVSSLLEFADLNRPTGYQWDPFNLQTT